MTAGRTTVSVRQRSSRPRCWSSCWSPGRVDRSGARARGARHPRGAVLAHRAAALESNASVGVGDAVHRQPATPGERRGPAEAWIRAIAFVVLVATICLALFLLFLLARRLREAHDARGRRAERPEEVGFDVIEAPAVVAREILHDAEAQRPVLAAGPRATRSSSAGTGSRPAPRRPGSPGSRGRPRRSSPCASSSWWPQTIERPSGLPACEARFSSPSTR